MMLFVLIFASVAYAQAPGAFNLAKAPGWHSEFYDRFGDYVGTSDTDFLAHWQIGYSDQAQPFVHANTAIAGANVQIVQGQYLELTTRGASRTAVGGTITSAKGLTFSPPVGNGAMWIEVEARAVGVPANWPTIDLTVWHVFQSLTAEEEDDFFETNSSRDEFQTVHRTTPTDRHSIIVCGHAKHPFDPSQWHVYAQYICQKFSVFYVNGIAMGSTYTVKSVTQPFLFVLSAEGGTGSSASAEMDVKYVAVYEK